VINFFGSFKTIEDGRFPYYLVQTHYSGCKNIDTVDLHSEKPKIVCLGCSITYGVHSNPEDNLRIDDSYPNILNNELSDTHSVLNMGVVGSGLKFQIDWFKFYYKDINNIETVVLQISDYQRQPMKPWQNNELYHHTHDFGSRVLLKNFHEKTERNKTFFETIKQYTPCEVINVEKYCIEMVNQDFIGNQFDLIVDFQGFLKAMGIKLIILYYEYWDSFPELKTLNMEYFSKIKEYCDFNGIELLGKITTNELKSSDLLLDSVHLNKDGNKLLAEKIKDRL
jgi:hypothetical protein